ncbi:hypothetical protein C8F01DRAFT_1232277 [Mycena amicta]|nr:hypothetical protein C8F01DRAFT_1232277 [Mycena amicta]
MSEKVGRGLGNERSRLLSFAQEEKAKKRASFIRLVAGSAFWRNLHCSTGIVGQRHSLKPPTNLPSGPPPPMLFLLVVVSFLTTNRSTAVPLPFLPLEDRDAPDTCKDIDNCRRLFDIVWGCLATVFACVWVSIHPNVPPPPPPALPKSASLWRQVKWKLIDSQGPLGLRLKLMLVGLLAPELIAGFAARQLAMAWKMSKKYNVSLTHGFFFCMGGFVDRAGHPIVTFAQIDSEQEEATNDRLSAADQSGTNESVELLPRSEATQSETKTLRAIQRTTEAAIKDKSKGDAFSKGIAFFQGLWFVMQCIARTAQHLPLTELEVATLAFAVVNIFTWSLWWSKLLDVRDPIVIEVSPQYNGAMPAQQPRSWDSKFASLLGSVYNVEEYNPIANNAVPTFWFSSEEDLDAVNNAWDLVISGQFFVAAIFGAIHCIAWHAAFPTIAEMWLWRVSAVLIAGVPWCLVSLRLFLWLEELYDFEFVSVGNYQMFILIAMLFYIPLRLILLVLPFTALRTVPSATFVDVDWSVYIPHL